MRITTWTPVSRSSAAISRVASMPSITGIWMSIEDDVGPVLAGERDALLAVRGLADHLDVVLGLQQGPEARRE